MTVPRGAYVFAEADYLYGAGPLTLRIEQIDYAHPVTHDRDVWLQVDGEQLDFRGADVGHRSALIRRRRLPITLQQLDWPGASSSPPDDQ